MNNIGKMNQDPTEGLWDENQTWYEDLKYREQIQEFQKITQNQRRLTEEEIAQARRSMGLY